MELQKAWLILILSFACMEMSGAGSGNAADWCVANPSALEANQQKDIDVLCNVVDCGSIGPGGNCFEPNTVLDHASVVFNLYYKDRASNPRSCNFGGDAMITTADPSFGSCIFP